ncbi:MAG: NAD(P)H-dependent oxidoreductase subunit E [Lentimicrobiaceae bacterium]|nr:NAD(P)H-dependent oxidoreductase subunit E [Lentimicrobiaceae bacterium]MCB9024131.1 NAD(P)H-dependent oxidoreductase subunit E [Lentimicrobiaceae bacterium]MCO5264915.1 NAD(P)H-dependent oxidoreductase subunit E [Lentimicrobium sp.]
MDERVDIQICLGSSCFSRGNKRLVKVVDEYLNVHNLRHLVHFHGAHCFSSCDKGPLLHIDGREYDQLTEEKVIAILDRRFGSADPNI